MYKEHYVENALAKVWNDLQDDYHVLYLAVQGSTNYNLDVYSDEYMSDVDMKAFVMPKFEDLYFNKRVSKTLMTEFGQVEVKDVRLLPELLGKMNSSYLELLYTPYYLMDENFAERLDRLRELGPDLVKDRFALLVKSMRGMVLEKQNAMCHEYEGLKDKLAAFGGYDPKQLHHAYRLLFMLDGMVNDEKDFGEVLEFNDSLRDFLLNVKVNGVGDVLTAMDMMDNVVEQVQELYDKVWDNKTPKSEYLVKSTGAMSVAEAVVYMMVRDHFTEVEYNY